MLLYSALWFNEIVCRRIVCAWPIPVIELNRFEALILRKTIYNAMIDVAESVLSTSTWIDSAKAALSQPTNTINSSIVIKMAHQKTPLRPIDYSLWHRPGLMAGHALRPGLMADHALRPVRATENMINRLLPPQGAVTCASATQGVCLGL